MPTSCKKVEKSLNLNITLEKNIGRHNLRRHNLNSILKAHNLDITILG